MRLGAIAFLGGVLFLCTLGALPDVFFIQFLPVAAFFGLFSAGSRLRLVAWFVCGFLWAQLHGQMALSGRLPAALAGPDLIVEGVISSLPVRTEHKTRFLFHLIRAEQPAAAWGRDGLVRLNWYAGTPDLIPGETWRLQVRLKAPRGFRNPGGFDYEKWLFQQDIDATGYVRAQGDNRKIDADNQAPLTRLRWHLAREIHRHLPDTPSEGIVKALAIGVRNSMGDAQWKTLRETGTAHLMAISGLHIGLIATLVFWGVRWLWTRCPRCLLLIPGARLAAPVAFMAACCYGALAGFSLPTQRALVMVFVLLAGVYWRNHISAGFSLALALWALLLWDPFAALSVGFWLSFGAVAVILFGMRGYFPVRDWWWHWGRVQVLVGIGLLPLTMYFFQQHPLVGPVANLVAVPWVGFVVLPLVLLGTCFIPLFPDWGGVLLQGGALAIDAIWPFLQGLASLDFVYNAVFSPSLWQISAAAVGVFLLLVPWGPSWRWLGLCWLLPLFFTRALAPLPGAVWFTLLDVGQGLAAVVRTRTHVLIYDTGPRYGPGFDAGKAALIPYLRSQGVAFVDRVIISHPDQDHAGGLESLLAEYPVDTLMANALDTPTGVAHHRTCRRGHRWRWDGVDFAVLHPGGPDRPDGPDRSRGISGNNASCVLKISNSEGVILLTGDIERRAERALVRHSAQDLKADVLVVSHHGSRGASSQGFARAVSPRFALFSAGFGNRFGLPHDSVLDRFEALKATPLLTSRHGAIGFQLTPGAGVFGPVLHRTVTRHFWHP